MDDPVEQALKDLSLACRNARLGYDWIDPRIEAIREAFAEVQARAEGAERDSRRLDALEIEVAEGGPIVLHNGEGTAHRGLGMANTGRTLRQAIDALCALQEPTHAG